MNYPYVRQLAKNDCGPTCLLMIIKYYKGNENINELIERTKTNKEGTTAYNILEVAKELGFDTKGIETINYDKLTYPAIAHVKKEKGYHYVVIYKYDHKKNQLLIADPSEGINIVKEAEFRKISTNIFLLLKPYKKIEYRKNTENINTIKSIFKLNKREITHLIFITIILLIITILVMINYQMIFEKPIQVRTFISIIILIILKQVVLKYKELKTLKIGLNIDSYITDITYKKAIFSPYRFFINNHQDDLAFKIIESFNIKDYFIEVLLFIINTIILVIPSIIIMLFINMKITIIYMIIMTLYLIISNLRHKDLNTHIRKINHSFKNINDYISNQILNYETIQNLNNHKVSLEKFTIHLNDYKQTKYEEMKKIIKTIISNNLKIEIIQVLIIYALFISVRNQALSFIEAFSLYYLMIIINNEIINLKNTMISLKTMNYIITKINSFKRKIKIKNKNEISFNKFNYSIDENKILNDISLTIDKSQKIAIIGKNGSGKTTLMRIIKGYYNNNNYNNVLMLTENDSNNYHFDQLNEHLKKMFFIDFNINEDYKYLSGGQKQKLMLCEMFKKEADVYILDEATNQIDKQTERQILKNIINSFKKKTIIYISHSKENIDLFQKTYYFEKGGIYAVDHN